MAKENQWTGLERPEDEGGEEKLDIGRVFPEKSDSTTMRQLLRKKKKNQDHISCSTCCFIAATHSELIAIF